MVKYEENIKRSVILNGEKDVKSKTWYLDIHYSVQLNLIWIVSADRAQSSIRVPPRDSRLSLTRVRAAVVVTPASADRLSLVRSSNPGLWLAAGAGAHRSRRHGALTGCPEWDHNSWLLSSAGGTTTRCRGELSVIIKAGSVCAFICWWVVKVINKQQRRSAYYWNYWLLLTFRRWMWLTKKITSMNESWNTICQFSSVTESYYSNIDK